jgi:hypothetical protein
MNIYRGKRDRHCPFCGAKNDASTEIWGGSGAPNDGDFSVCFSCGTICVFDEKCTKLRKPTDAESHAAMDNPQLRSTIFKAKMLILSFNQKVRREPTN